MEKRDKNSGALLIFPSKEEKKLIELENKIKKIETYWYKINKKLDYLIKLMEDK